MSNLEIVRLILYCGAAVALRLAIRVARIYFDKELWEGDNYPHDVWSALRR